MAEEPTTLAELHAAFLESHGKIRGHGHRRFEHLHGDDREEKIAELVARAWHDYYRLYQQGREIEGKRGGIAKFAGKTVASGRTLVAQSIQDVMSPAKRHGHNLGEPREHEWVDEHSPAEAVALRVDLAAWIETLTEPQREVVELMMQGFNTADIGRMRGVTRAAIHLVRKELIASWTAFHGEDPQ